jgi:hypothetical protein
MKYAVEIGSAAMICNTKFHKDRCRDPKVHMGGGGITEGVEIA